MIPCIWKSEQAKLTYHDRNLNTVFLCRFTYKGAWRILWGDGSTLYYDWGVGYIDVYICKNSSTLHLRCLHLLYISHAPRKLFLKTSNKKGKEKFDFYFWVEWRSMTGQISCQGQLENPDKIHMPSMQSNRELWESNEEWRD